MAWCGGSRTAQPESPDRGVLQGDSGYPPPTSGYPRRRTCVRIAIPGPSPDTTVMPESYLASPLD